MQNKPTFSWQFENLPFFWKPLKKPSNGKNIPDSLLFCLYVEKNTGTLMQKPNRIVSDTLSLVYRKGSKITGLMQNRGIGRQYAEDFINFINNSLKRDSLSNLRILEIGCGTGYLLYRLKCLGGDVLGLEPGAHGQAGKVKYDVPVIKDFFPSDHLKEKFDLIIIYAVLEHIEKPTEFLRLIGEHLVKDGKIILSVPNCEPYIEYGDISMLLHEHWSYFTSNTLKQTLRCAGGQNIFIQNSGFGGTLYGITSIGGEIKQANNNEISYCEKQAYNFQKLAKRSISRIFNVFENAARNEQTVSIYVPNRIINMLTMLDTNLNFRFFDDNIELHGTFFPGIDIPIEGRNDLLNNPTDVVMIMSNSFGKIIAKEIKPELPRNTVIITWHEIFNIS